MIVFFSANERCTYWRTAGGQSLADLCNLGCSTSGPAELGRVNGCMDRAKVVRAATAVNAGTAVEDLVILQVRYLQCTYVAY